MLEFEVKVLLIGLLGGVVYPRFITHGGSKGPCLGEVPRQ